MAAHATQQCVPAKYCDLEPVKASDDQHSKRVRLWTPIGNRGEGAVELTGELLEAYTEKSAFGKLYTGRAREWVRSPTVLYGRRSHPDWVA